MQGESNNPHLHYLYDLMKSFCYPPISPASVSPLQFGYHLIEKSSFPQSAISRAHLSHLFSFAFKSYHKRRNYWVPYILSWTAVQYQYCQFVRQQQCFFVYSYPEITHFQTKITAIIAQKCISRRLAQLSSSSLLVFPTALREAARVRHIVVQLVRLVELCKYRFMPGFIPVNPPLMPEHWSVA